MMTQVEFDQAVENWSTAWQNGDPLGAFNLGMAYYSDKGANKDFAKAIDWCTKAAESLARAKSRVSADQDAFPAQLALGLAYYKGDGVPKDEAKAVEIWSKVDAFWPKAFVGKWKRR